MKQEAESEDGAEVEDVPISPLFSAERRNRYGSVPGLDDEELADVRELERQVMLEEWGPVLRLPVRTRRGWIQPTLSEDGGVEWGAFGSVDFERTMSEFDKARYKADMLQEKLRDVLIMFSIVSDRLPRAKYKVLEHLRRGFVELEDIENDDMRALGKLYPKARQLQKEIRELREASWARRRGRVAEVLQ